MYDKELALDSLYNIQDALLLITERAAVANTAGRNVALGCYLHELDSTWGSRKRIR